MKKFLFRLLLFPLPILGLILALPINREWQFKHYGNSCMQRESWIYDRIHHSDTPIDLLFLGSSHTINAVDDVFLQNHLSQELEVVNFGYCFFGRDLHLLLLGEVLKKKRPKALVLEVRQRENKGGHPVFPYLTSTSELVLTNPFGSGRYLNNLKDHLSYKLKHVQGQLGLHKAPPPYEMEESGFFTLSDTANVGMLENAKTKRAKRGRRGNKNMASFPKRQLKYMSDLCQKNGIDLYLLYLPSFGEPNLEPVGIDFYKELGRIILPPTELLDNPHHWYDEGHFNTAGAEKLGEFLLKELDSKL